MTRDQLDAYGALCLQLRGAARLGETRAQTVAMRAALGLDAGGNVLLSDHGQRVKAWARATAKAMRNGDPMPEKPTA